jgi:hypothetical protein
MRRISSYIAIISILIISLPVHAQKEEKPDSIPWWNGVRVELDIASPIFSATGQSDGYSVEGALSVNLKYKYFPVVEFGTSGLKNKISVNEAIFSANGLFGKVGVDVNLLKYNAAHADNLFLVGGRIGMSSFSYDLMNVIVADDYWDMKEVRDFPNMSATKWWFEIVVGVRVMVFRNVFMGWSVRNKSMLGKTAEGEIFPYFVPGYGNSQTSNWAFNYVIGYKF